jgi:site-specific recombinase
MENGMFQQAFALALIGVVGTGVGVIASLILTEFVAQRDFHDRIAKMCNILSLEAARIQSWCQEYNNITRDTTEKSKQDPNYFPHLHTFSRLPFVAGQAALSNGDFVAQIPKQTVAQLSRAYAELDILNALIDGYSLFTQTSRELLNFRSSVIGYYESLSTLCSTILAEFQPLQREIINQLAAHGNEAVRQHKRIQVCKLIGGCLLVLAVVSLVVFLILSAISPAQPIPTPMPTPTV